MNVDMDKKSKYVNMTEKECVKKHKASCRIPAIIGVVFVLFLLIVYLYIAITKDASWFLTLFLLILDMIVVIVLRGNASIQWQSLQDIINLDCDPQKYLNILKVFKEEDKKKKAWSTLHIFMARAYYSLKNYDAMKDCLEQIHFKKTIPSRELIILNLQGNYYIRTNQPEQLEICRTKMLEMKQNKNFPQKAIPYIDAVFEMWDYTLYIQQKKPEEARKLLNSKLSNTKTPYDAVATSFSLAEIELLCGNTEEAKKHLIFVKTYGNTMAAQKEAEKMLDEFETMQ